MQNNGINLIVMGTTGEFGLSGLGNVSTAKKPIEQVDCSVLTVKPVNFKSTVIY